MTNIKFRRGNTRNLPIKAPSGMPLWCEDTSELYVGTDTGIKKINAQSYDLLPVGIIIYYGGVETPPGFLICNGAVISRTTYGTLFNIIGTKFGSGDGSSTFTLPNLINRFIEGSTNVGSYISAGLPQHQHSGAASSFSNLKIFHNDDWFGGWICQGTTNTGNANNSIYGNSDTVQPPALTLLPCIKY